jgi:hypothetical protein
MLREINLVGCSYLDIIDSFLLWGGGSMLATQKFFKLHKCVSKGRKCGQLDESPEREISDGFDTILYLAIDDKFIPLSQLLSEL